MAYLFSGFMERNLIDSSIGTILPNHPELKIGTLKGILKLAKINEEEFIKYQ